MNLTEQKAIDVSRDPRSGPMAEMHRAGKTLAEIGVAFNLTRERVRQLLLKDFGIRRVDGGQHKKVLLRQEQLNARREAACMATYGCTLAQYALVSGAPAMKYNSQRILAGRRGVGWEFNLWQWWVIWQESGKWTLRGRGQGYVMCRFGDLGPYAAGNVFIGLATNNSSEARRKDSDLPVGVRKNKRYAGYSSTRIVKRVRHSLGSFPTAELARAAYEAVAPIGSGPNTPGKPVKIRKPRPQLPAALIGAVAPTKTSARATGGRGR